MRHVGMSVCEAWEAHRPRRGGRAALRGGRARGAQGDAVLRFSLACYMVQSM